MVMNGVWEFREELEFENLLKPQNNFTAAEIRLLGVIWKPEKNKRRRKSHCWTRNTNEQLTEGEKIHIGYCTFLSSEKSV